VDSGSIAISIYEVILVVALRAFIAAAVAR
jgi:hypothetical protein